MTEQFWRAAIVSALMSACIAPAFAHGGGLNAQGCHTNRKTGDYHCHRFKGACRKADPLF
jgi:hypothetical protein